MLARREANPASRQRSYDGGTLRKLDPVAVRIKDHGNSCNISERRGCETLPGAGCKCSGMNFVNFEDLEGDVPPSRSVPSGIERGVGSLLQDDQALKRQRDAAMLLQEPTPPPLLISSPP